MSKVKDLDKIRENPKKYADSITVKRLVTLLQKFSDIYYGSGDPLVSDQQYDIMFDVLKERDPKNSFLFQTGTSNISKEDVELPYPMPSLNKIKPSEKSLEKYFKKYNGPFILSDKLDGISGQLYKDKDGNIDLFTKKQTRVGTSKKHLIKYLFNDDVLNNIPKGMSIRGEIIISKEDFKLFSDTFKNARNMMAGFLNTEKIDKRIAEKSKFIAYGMIYPTKKYSDQMKILKKIGIDVVYNEQLDDSKFGIKDYDSDEEKLEKIESYLKNKLQERKTKSIFEIDGIVIGDNSKAYKYSEENPKYTIAFKMNVEADMKIVKVEKVLWEPSMHGIINPSLKVEKVRMGGVDVQYVTAFNALYVKDNKIGKGTKLKIVRSGDVIPHIVEVVKPNKKPDMPDIPYEWGETGVDIFVIDPDEDTIRSIETKRILHFFRSIGVKYLSDGLVAKLYDNGYDSVIKILKASSNKSKKLYDIDGMGKKIVLKIYDEIDKAMETAKLNEVMAGSVIFGRAIGKKKIKEIISEYPNILDYHKDDKSKLVKMIEGIDGFSKKLSERFVRNLKKFYNFYQEILDNTKYEIKIKKKNKIDNKKESKLEGFIIVFTGFRSKELEEFIEDNGGKISSSVSKKTSLLLYVKSDKLGSKYEKAKNLGIETMTKEDFESKYVV